ncbi:MAG: hypothetical protein CMJ78_22355 [Planctomycetaceae bacterium]|nr:hypothetical protein [Planctomycetaceae bacterium]
MLVTYWLKAIRNKLEAAGAKRQYKVRPHRRRQPLSAQPDAATAAANLQSALNAFQTSVDGISDTYNLNVAAIDQTFESNVATIGGNVRTDVQTEIDNFESAEGTLTDAFETLVDGHANTAELTLDAAEALFDSLEGAANSLLQNENQSTTTAFTNAVNGADNAFSLVDTAQLAILDTAYDTAGDTFNTTQQGADQALNLFIASQQTAFDSGHTALRAIHDGNVTTADATHQFDVQTAETIRDTATSPFPYIDYDPSLITTTPAFTAVLDNGQQTYSDNIALLDEFYQNNIEGHYVDYDNDLENARNVRQGLIDAADDQYRLDVAQAQSTYEAAIATAENDYGNAVYGLGGLEESFDLTVDFHESVFDSAVEAAEQVYDSVVDPAHTVFETAVETAQEAFDRWADGEAGPSSTTSMVETIKVSKIEFFTGLTLWRVDYETLYSGYGDVITWSETSRTEPVVSVRPGGTTTVTTMVNLVATTTVTTHTANIQLDKSSPVRNPSGGVLYRGPMVITSSSTPAATSLNPYELALHERALLLYQRLDQIQDKYEGTLDNIGQTLVNNIDSANDNYDNLLAPLETGLDTALSVIAGGFNGFVANEFNTYTGIETSFWETNASSMTTGTPPNLTPLYTAAKNFYVNNPDKAVDSTIAAGAQIVGFVTAERALDTTRDQAIIQAHYTADVDEANAEKNAADKVINAQEEFLLDVADINTDYEIVTETRTTARDQSIANAAHTFELVVNGEEETKGKAVTLAQKGFDYGYASALEVFNLGELTEWVDLATDSINASQVLTTALGVASHDRLDSYAAAGPVYTALATAAGVNLANDLGTERINHTSDIGNQGVLATTTVATSLASMYSSYFGGSPDVTTVADAWKDYAIDLSEAARDEYNTIANSLGTFWNDTESLSQSIETLIAGADTTYGTLMRNAESARRNVAITSVTSALESFADDAKDYADTVVTEVRNLYDSASGAANSFINDVNTDYIPYMTSVAAQALSSVELVIDDFAIALRDSTDEVKTQRVGQFLHLRNAFLSIASADDPVAVERVKDDVSQAVLDLVIYRDEVAGMNVTIAPNVTPIPLPPSANAWLLENVGTIGLNGLVGFLNGFRTTATQVGSTIDDVLSGKWWDSTISHLSFSASYNLNSEVATAGRLIATGGPIFGTLNYVGVKLGLVTDTVGMGLEWVASLDPEAATRGELSVEFLDEVATAGIPAGPLTKGAAKLKRLLKLKPQRTVNQAAEGIDLADDVLREVDSVVLERLRLGAEIEIPAGTRGIRKMMSDLSVVSGNEVGLLRMADGRRLLVMGGPNAIRLPRNTARIIAHTHPRGRLSFSAADLRALNARGQTMSVIISPWDDIAVILRVGGN